MMKTIPYGKQNITEDDLKAVMDTLKSDYLTQGPKIAEFEQAFADYIGCRYAVAVNNGTSALHLCAMVMQVNEKSNVITTPITFAASANCIRYCGGNVYFADIEPETFCLSISKVKELIDSKPKGFFQGIIPVDFAGYPVQMEQYREVADANGLWLIEDACHAPGAYFKDSKGRNQSCGNGLFSDLATYSFHPVKHIACGEGGMITTDDENLYKKILINRTHGITRDPDLLRENHGGWFYEMQTLGYNYRLTDFQAALGLSQLSRAEKGLIRRREIAATYYESFKSKSFILGQSGVVEGHAYHLYIIRVADRKNLYDYLRTQNILCQVHYIPVHTFPYYQALGNKKGNYPVAEKFYEQCLSLPMFPTLTHEEQQHVVNSIMTFYKG